MYENGKAKLYERRVGSDGKESFRKIDNPPNPLKDVFEQLKRDNQGASFQSFFQPTGSDRGSGSDEFTPSSRSSRAALWFVLGTLLLAFGFYRTSHSTPDTPSDVHQQETTSGERLTGSEQLS